MRYAGAPPEKYCAEFRAHYSQYLQASFRIYSNRY